MSETKWTPAPWQMRHAVNEAGYPCYYIAGFSGSQKYDAHLHDANVRLMSAAPDMYAALEQAEAIVAKHVYPKPDAGPDHPWNVLGRMREALAKARGAR